MKRKDVLSWDEYFMGLAHLSALRSKDPNTQVGACIVSPDYKVVGIGYNGFPAGCSDDVFPWDREGLPLETKYLYDIFTNSKILKKIGEISFPIYLVHYILLNKLRLSQPILRALAVVVISILLAVILNKLIEQPMIKLSKKINNKFLEG